MAENRRVMKKKVLLIVLFVVGFTSNAQVGLWKKSNLALEEKRTLLAKERPFEGVFELDWNQWQLNVSAHKSIAVASSKQIITLPNAEGKMEEFAIVENSNFDPGLQLKYPNIQSFSGKGITDPKATVYFSSSANGIQTMVLRSDAPAEFLEPIRGEKGKYILYRSDKKNVTVLPFRCTTAMALGTAFSDKSAKTKASDRVFRTLRLALSCTGEYAAFHGGTVEGALAAMNATMTRVNGVFNSDLALKLVLVDNSNVIYTNASTDPYSTVVGGEAPSAWSQELENTLTRVLGSDTYDIGHLFGASGGGGNSGCIGCVCQSDKARAYTSPVNDIPQGDLFDIDFVAHEFGHQLGATHTFSHDLDEFGTNVEPGGGSTIMGYAGITDYNVQENSDDYFAFASILQIQQNLATKSCPIPTPITTPIFGVAAGNDVIIPKSTPFQLKGSTSGTVNASFTYVWEQNDSATTTSGSNSLAHADKIDGPLFRSFPPTSVLHRYFPSYDKVLANRLQSEWESVSSIGRTLTFVFTARDNDVVMGQTASDEVKITVSSTIGPFEVTSQNTTDLSWNQGSNQMITWNVNGTNTLSGAANVNIKLSTDGGLTFPTTLISNTPNDGSQAIVVPNVGAALNCRILIEPTNAVFYGLNSVPFAIGYTTVSACNTFNFATPIAIPDDVSTYTTREVVVPDNLGEVTSVTVDLVISHSYLSDVELEIVSPKKKVVRLLQRICGGTNETLRLKLEDSGVVVDCANTATQVIAPADLLSSYKGENPSGIWVLRVRDAFSGDSGTISAASVTLCTQKATLGTNDLAIADFKLFPNPSKGTFKIEFTSTTNAPITISVVDVLGRKVYENQFENAASFSEMLDLQNVNAGIYVLTVEQGNRKQTQKIIVN